MLGCAADESSADSPNSSLEFSKFDEALNRAISDYNASAPAAMKIAGASSAIVHEKLGVVHTQGYGEFKADRLYLIASSSKMLSAGVLMRLADQGKLDVDKPVATYLSNWGDAPTSNITIAQMVSNSSGMPSLSEVSAAARDTTSPYASNLCEFLDAGSLETCAKTLYATPPPRKPDTMFAYGGSQWQLAGAVAEHVSGKRWAQLIQETYVEPCGAPSLGFTNQFGRAGGTAYPTFFMADKANLPVTENPSIEGGAYVTAPDYAKLLLMHLRGGKCGETQVLSQAAVARMHKNRLQEYGGKSGNETMPGYGFGFWVSPDQSVVADPGAYGAYPLLDLKRRYAMFIVIEVTSEVGGRLAAAVKPTLDAIFDEAQL